MRIRHPFTSLRPRPGTKSPLPVCGLADTGRSALVPDAVNEETGLKLLHRGFKIGKASAQLPNFIAGQLCPQRRVLLFQFLQASFQCVYAGSFLWKVSTFLKRLSFSGYEPAVGKAEPVMKFFQIFGAWPLTQRPLLPLARRNLQKIAKATNVCFKSF